MVREPDQARYLSAALHQVVGQPPKQIGVELFQVSATLWGWDGPATPAPGREEFKIIKYIVRDHQGTIGGIRQVLLSRVTASSGKVSV